MAEVNGYHLWSLPDDSVKEFEESIGFTVLRNDLSDGYRSKVLFGSENGVRRFKLRLPTLGHIDVLPNTVEGVYGEAVSREEYVWQLYCETQVTGEPFVYRSRRNGQYYLVEFVDKELTYSGMRVKLYSTGLDLQQVRIQGVTVFDLSMISNTDKDYSLWNDTGGTNATEWQSTPHPDAMTLSPLTKTGDVSFSGGTQNGNTFRRLNNSASTGYLDTATLGGSVKIYDFFIVMKMREATFSNDAVIFSEKAAFGTQYLKGTSAGTVFQDTTGGSVYYEYRKNGDQFAVTAMAAPMNEWGVVHLRFPGINAIDPGTIAATGWRFGASPTPGDYAKVDIGEILVTAALFPLPLCREITEHLIVKWGVNA